MRGYWPKALASPLPVIQKAASAPISAPAAPIEVSQTQNPPNQRHASLRASPAACERLLAVWRISAWDSLIAPLAASCAASMREAWEARQSRTASDTVAAPGQTPEPESARSLAERLRKAAQGIDRGTLAEATARLQESREAEERQRVQEAERLKEQERQQERLRERQAPDLDRDSGISH